MTHCATTLSLLIHDEAGAILSAELVIVLTVAVLAMVVGLSEVAVAVNTELCDISSAIGALNQSYAFTGFSSFDFWTGHVKSRFAGSAFTDFRDVCDCGCSIVTCTGGGFAGCDGAGFGSGFAGGAMGSPVTAGPPVASAPLYSAPGPVYAPPADVCSPLSSPDPLCPPAPGLDCPADMPRLQAPNPAPGPTLPYSEPRPVPAAPQLDPTSPQPVRPKA